MIEEVQKGETPTLLEADKANELIKAINALTNMRIERGGTLDFIQISENNSILTLQDFPQVQGQITGNTINAYVCINGVAVLKKIFVDES